MRTALLVVFLLAQPCWAASVYKCKGPNGEVTFTNIKCPERSETQHYGNYQRVQDAPDPSLYNQPERTSEDASFATEVSPVAPVTQTPRVVGYQCSVEGRAWIQTSHCPPSTIRHVDGDVSGYHHQSGNAAPSHRLYPGIGQDRRNTPRSRGHVSALGRERSHG